MSFDGTPPRSAVVATTGVAGIVVVAVVAIPAAGLLALLGATGIVVGTARGSRLVLGVGSFCQLLAVLLAGVASLSTGLVLIALLAAVLAWDVGEQAINVSSHLGRDARIQRPIAVHATVTTLVGAVTLGGVYVTYSAASGGQPLAALLLLLVGGATVVFAMRL